MQNRIDLTPVLFAGGDERTINAIQLLDTVRGVTLITASQYPAEGGFPPYRMVLSAAPLGSPDAEQVKRFDIALLMPSPSAWEVTARKNGELIAVYEFNGGAVNALFIEDAAGNKTAVSNRYPFNSFHFPHFIRGTGAARGNAVLASQDKKEVVLFLKDRDGQFGQFQTLADGADAILLEGDHGRLLISRTVIPGSSKFELLPGMLHATRVTSDYQPESSHPVLPDDMVIYAFDACLVKEEIYLLALTDRGVLLLKSSLHHGPVHFTPMLEVGGADRRFSHPSVTTSGTALFGALIENVRQDNAAIVYFKLPIGTGSN